MADVKKEFSWGETLGGLFDKTIDVIPDIAKAFSNNADNPQAELDAVRRRQLENQSPTAVKPIYTDGDNVFNNKTVQYAMFGGLGLIGLAVLAKVLK